MDTALTGSVIQSQTEKIIKRIVGYGLFTGCKVEVSEQGELGTFD